ncbi:hypothetical protein HDU83_005033 [Entophlyctis luteolus]|nr:hypothetical protein HDU83_005033 [Entophlyctis luteolus]
MSTAPLPSSSPPQQKRIVSMLPSACEIVCLCGGESMLVGRSHEDDFPANVLSLPVTTGQKTVFTSSIDVERQVQEALASGTGLYTVDGDLLKELKPTHIVTQDLCHVCSIDLQTVERVAKKMEPTPKIITLNPLKFSDVIEDVYRVGLELGLEDGARRAVQGLQERIDRAKAAGAELLAAHGGRRKRCLFVEWTDPVYPGGHWTPQLIHMAGGVQPIAPATELVGAGPSVAVTHEQCIASDPEFVIIAPCGLALEKAKYEADLIRDLDWFKTLTSKSGVTVCVVDGNQMFNRPGPRLVDALEFLVGFLWGRDDLIPSNFPWMKYTV